MEKNVLLSRTFWGVLIMWLGNYIDIPEGQEDTIAGYLDVLATTLGALLALWGRQKAAKTGTKLTLKPVKPRHLVIILCVFTAPMGLTGCVSSGLQKDSQAVSEMPTAKKRLFAAVSDYELWQLTAVNYRTQCAKMPTPQCREDVKQFQEIDRKAVPVIDAALAPSISDPTADELATALTILTSQLRQYLYEAVREGSVAVTLPDK